MEIYVIYTHNGMVIYDTFKEAMEALHALDDTVVGWMCHYGLCGMPQDALEPHKDLEFRRSAWWLKNGDKITYQD